MSDEFIISYQELDTSQVWAGLLCIFIELSLILLKLDISFWGFSNYQLILFSMFCIS